MMKKVIQAFSRYSIVCLMGLVVMTNVQAAGDEFQQVRAVINTLYDTPQHKVVIDPIVIQGQHAVASWVQQNRGGRVVLYRTVEGQWSIVLCAGSAVTHTAFLVETGISHMDAELLAQGLIAAEAKLGKEKIALFDSFNGVVRGAHQADHGDVHANHKHDRSVSH